MPSNIISIATRRAWEPRVHSRVTVELVGSLSGSGPRVECLVDDISASGARVAPVEKLGRGDRLRLVIPHLSLDIAITVAWTSRDAAGVCFEVGGGRLASPDCAQSRPAQRLGRRRTD